MPNPQNPELRRSEEGNIRPRVELGPDPTDVGGETGTVPPDNQPGHHPQQEQDKPPADKFAEALGIKSDTELAGGDGGEVGGAGRRAAKKAGSRKAAAKRATTGPAAAPAASPRPRTGKAAAETPVQPTPTPPPRVATGTGTGTGTDAPTPADEPAGQAAAQHHHALPDEELPHDAGMVTPSGTPVTARVLTWPLRYCGTALKTSGGVISAYGNAVRKLGERLSGGGR